MKLAQRLSIIDPTDKHTLTSRFRQAFAEGNNEEVNRLLTRATTQLDKAMREMMEEEIDMDEIDLDDEDAT
jgi:hypothetical protein